MNQVAERNKLSQWLVGITLASGVWFFAYSQLTAFADWVISLLGLTRQTVIAIEQGKYSPSLEVAFQIAAVFDTGIDAVFAYEAEAD